MGQTITSLAHVIRHGCLALSLLGLSVNRVDAGTYEQAVEQTAMRFVSFVNDQGDRNATVNPQFRGLPSMPGGGATGFTELFKEFLAPHGIQLSGRARYSIEARLELGDARKSAQMFATVYNQNGRRVQDFENLPTIDDPKDLAEILGIPTYFGPDGDPESRQESFQNEFDDQTFFTAPTPDGRPQGILFSDSAGKYGLAIKVNSDYRTFTNQDGLPYTSLDYGETYTLMLVNNTNQEVAANVKVDGVNVFHFSDPSARRPDGQKLKYWIVRPHSQLEVKGWYKSSRSSQRFAITSVEQGAAARAGISLKDIGLVTATFHASWEGNSSPADEPQITKVFQNKISRKVPVTKTREVEFEIRLPNGKTEKRTRTETYTEMREVHSVQNRVATGFGEEVLTNTKGLNRTIGISRATLAFRYERPQ